MDEILKQLREEFLGEIEKKNSWGKNEIKALYLTSAYNVLSKNLKDEKMVDSTTR